jgi:hypothetical protein
MTPPVNRAFSEYTSAFIDCDQRRGENAKDAAAMMAAAEALEEITSESLNVLSMNKRHVKNTRTTAPAPLTAESTLTRCATSPQGIAREKAFDKRR